MADFLTQSACCGIWPQKIEVSEFHSRPDLVSRLMRERRVPRFIIAPDGLGKSVLACEYAETVFSFNHVFWIDCRSPCFFRDIDDKSLGDGIIRKDGQVRLVVFDGLGLLDEVRVDAFVEAVEKLLEHMCEVVVTLSPSGDVYGRLFRDRLCIDARDVLLSDAELEISRLMAQRAGESPLRFSLPGPDENEASRRIVSMVWGEDAGDALLGALVREELLIEVVAWMFVALVVRTAHLEDIPFLPRLESVDMEKIADKYPFFGLNVREGEFLTIDVDTTVISKAFSLHFDRIAASMHFENAEELHGAIAAHLLAQGRDDEACRYMRVSGTRAVRERWLAANGRELLLRGKLSTSCELFASLSPKRCRSGLEACMVHAWRLCLFGEREEARRLSTRVVSSPYADDGTRLFAAVLLSRCGTDEEQGKADASILRLLGLEDARTAYGAATRAAPGEGATAPCAAAHRRRAQDDAFFEVLRAACMDGIAPVEDAARLLACLCVVLHALPERARSMWHAWAGEGVSDNVLLVGATWILTDCPDSSDRALCSFARQRLEKRFEAEGLDVIALGAANALEARGGPKGLHAMFEVKTIDAILGARAMLICQQRDFCRARANEVRRDGSEMRGTMKANLGVGPNKIEMAHSNIPPLHVRLFGGMEVSIGDREIDETDFRRTKSRTLLALLVLAEGREVRSNTLMEQMWPGVNATCARRSLYTVWSQLRKTLRLADGSCPYLSRRQSGYRVENRYLISDVARANELCRSMSVQHNPAQKSHDLLVEFNELFSRKLLPNEIDNEMIVKMREEYQKRFVDALVFAATTLGREGRVDDALCFATCAFDTDHAREDVYLTLMRAQYQAGQRVQAMKTYMECRNFLSEELGIDPSSDVERLYLSFLEDDRALM